MDNTKNIKVTIKTLKTSDYDYKPQRADISKEREVKYREKQINLLKDFFRKVESMQTQEEYRTDEEIEAIIKIIKNILKTMENTGNRIMYHEVSNMYFNEDCASDELLDKLENLLRILYYKNNDCDDKYENLITFMYKIIDHSNLAQIQMSKIEKHQKEASDKLNSRIEDKLKDEGRKINKKIHEKLAESEKQYITILGIFAAIVLAFTGGIAFSTSALSNIDRASIYRLIFIMGMMGVILFNITCFMFAFIRKLNSKKR